MHRLAWCSFTPKLGPASAGSFYRHPVAEPDARRRGFRHGGALLGWTGRRRSRLAGVPDPSGQFRAGIDDRKGRINLLGGLGSASPG
jgi:hypothetical protein